jgi:penicillin G amidase
MAQGYVHAQDRFWEMDFRRHVTAGRLSELFGAVVARHGPLHPDARLARVAEQELALLDEPDPADARGLRRRGQRVARRTPRLRPLPRARPAAAHRCRRLPPRAVDARPTRWPGSRRWPGTCARTWRPSSSAVGCCWSTSARARLGGPLPRLRRDHLPDDPAVGRRRRRRRFVPASGDDGRADRVPAFRARPRAPTRRRSRGRAPVPARRPTRRGRRRRSPRRSSRWPPHRSSSATGRAPGIGSNSWAIAPSRSATGGALLANDPHLGPSQPSLWYQVRLRCAPVSDACPYDVAGFSFSGMPGIIIGHNADVAWAFTNLGPDVADLVIERIDGDRVLTAVRSGPHRASARRRSASPAATTSRSPIRTTPNGPLLSDVSDDTRRARRGTGPRPTAPSTRSRCSGPRSTRPHGERRARADDGTRLRDRSAARPRTSRSRARTSSTPTRAGNIAYQAPGRIPVRTGHDGTVPVPGWTGVATGSATSRSTSSPTRSTRPSG